MSLTIPQPRTALRPATTVPTDLGTVTPIRPRRTPVAPPITMLARAVPAGS